MAAVAAGGLQVTSPGRGHFESPQVVRRVAASPAQSVVTTPAATPVTPVPQSGAYRALPPLSFSSVVRPSAAFPRSFSNASSANYSVFSRAAPPSVGSLPSGGPVRRVRVSRLGELPLSPSLQGNGSPASASASSGGRGYQTVVSSRVHSRQVGVSQSPLAAHDLNWMTEYTKRVWPSIADWIGSKVRAKVQAYEFESGHNVLDDLDDATRKLQQLEFVFPPTHQWLNQVLKIFWPVLSQTVDLMVKEKIIPQVAQSVPSFLGTLELESCKFGVTPPEIKEFKVLTDPISTGWMDIECVIEFTTEPDLQLSLGNMLRIGLKKVFFSMTLFISFYGPMPRPPFFAGMSFYLSRAPHVETVWTHLGEFLSQELMNSLVSKAVKQAMVRYVLPHRKIKLLTEENCVMDIIQPEPRGCLKLTVVEAQGLVGTDFQLSTLWTGDLTTDPYVRINVGSLSWRSPTVENNTDPEWEEDNSVLMLIDIPERQFIELSIFDDGLRQKLQAKMQMADSVADEVARLGAPMSVTELFGCAAADLACERDTELWLDLESWWPGRFCNADLAQGAQAQEQDAGDEDSSPIAKRLSSFSPVSLIKDGLMKRTQSHKTRREDMCKNAKAKVKVRAEWKPLGCLPAPDDHREAVKRSAAARKQGTASALATDPLISDSSSTGGEDAVSSSEVDTDDDEEDVEWPSYVMSVALRYIDKIRCSDEASLTTTYQVSMDASRVVSADCKALSKTDKTTKGLLTRYSTKAVCATPVTTAHLGGLRDEENEAVARKVGVLLAQDVPVSVIASVLEIPERSVLRCCGAAMTQAGKLRELEFNDSAIFFLPDLPDVKLTFELNTIVNKEPQLMGTLHAHLNVPRGGVHRTLSQHPMNMQGKFRQSEALGACRATACIKIWPLVARAPGLRPFPNAGTLLEVPSKHGGQKLARVYISSARGLRKVDLFGQSDPYCIVKASKSKKNAQVLVQTRVIDNDLDPVWDHGPVTVQWDSVKELCFEVWDKDVLRKGDLLGKATLSKQKAMIGFHSDLDLGDGNGTLRVKICPTLYKKRPDGSIYLEEVPVAYQAPPPVDVFQVWVHSAADLKAANIIGGASDPFVLCTLGATQGFKTQAITGTVNPKWRHGPEKVEWRPRVKHLVFEVRDKDLVGSKFLGKAIFDKRDCIKGFDGPRSLGNGRGTLNVTIKPAGASCQSDGPRDRQRAGSSDAALGPSPSVAPSDSVSRRPGGDAQTVTCAATAAATAALLRAKLQEFMAMVWPAAERSTGAAD